MFSKPVLNRHFARHYTQMVIAMFVGMVALGIPAGWALGALGSSWAELREDAPAAMLGLMAITMTVPMSAWMSRMGHGWRPNVEMAGSMIVPTLGVIALLAAGIVTDLGGLLIIEHVAMFAGMFAVMALRPEDYSRPHHHHAPAAA
jgi:hypothetical protein